jgi:Uma2 family endonuclease
MSTVLEQPIDVHPDERTDHPEQRHDLERHHELEQSLRELAEKWPDRKVELIAGRIVVRELTSGAHNRIVFRLMRLLMAIASERGWDLWPHIYLFLGSQRDRYIPDLAAVPAEPQMWGSDSVYGEDTLLVAEIVSPSSQHDDNVVKPRECALGKVPLYLVIDTFAGKARLLSRPGDDGYAKEVAVKLGEPLDLPDPWSYSLDTGELIG